MKRNYYFILSVFYIASMNLTMVSSNFMFHIAENNASLPALPRIFFNSTSSLKKDKPVSDSGSFSLCSCKPASSCTPTDGYWNTIDIRIVTPTVGGECEEGEVYCCTSGMDCGSNRIIQVPEINPKPGQSDFGEYPWQALILSLGNDYVGSGALITNSHVVTAAHRLTYFSKRGQHLFARLGDWDLQGLNEPYPFVDILVNQISVHPQYDPLTLEYDVAVLTLLAPVQLAPNINPVCLPPPGSCFTGKTCWVSGWGKDMFGPIGNYQVLQKKVDVTVLNSNECNQRLRNTKLGPNFSMDQQSFICAGGFKGKDACTGDGGSPLVCQSSEGHWILAGLVAWGIGCAQNSVPGVYVNVAQMVNWIQDQAQQPIFNNKS